MNTEFIKHYILIVSLLLTVICPSGVLAHKVTIQKPEPYYAPDINFFDENEEKIFLDQFEGKTVLLVFWASWCGTCVSEMPSLDVLQKDFRKIPLEIIALSEDYLGVEAVKKYFSAQGIRHLKIYHDFKNKMFTAMQVIGLPSAYIIDPDGKIKVVLRGGIKWHDPNIRELILSEIKGNYDTPKNTYIGSTLNTQITPNSEIKPTK